MDVDVRLLPHQRKLFSSKQAKSCMICGRGAGKSYVMSVLALLALLQRKNVLIGGQRYDTLHDTLFAEIKRRASEWGIYDYLQWRESPMQVKYGAATLYSGTYESIDAARGYSEISLILLDEMFLAPISILEVWGECMRGPNVSSPRIVGATTPRIGSLWNTMMIDPACDWEIIQARTTDNTYISEEQYSLIVSNIRSDEMRKQELEGQILTASDTSCIIRLDQFPVSPAATSNSRVVCGLDMSHGVERDASAWFARRGNQVLDMQKWPSWNSEQVAQYIRQFNHSYKIDELNMDLAWSESVYDQLKYEVPCNQVQFAERAKDPVLYANVRAEMYFNLAWQIQHGLCVEGFALSPELKRQLCAINWLKTPQNRLLLMKKDDLRVILGMSTDIADAAALTCLERYSDDPAISAAISSTNENLRRKALAMMG